MVTDAAPSNSAFWLLESILNSLTASTEGSVDMPWRKEYAPPPLPGSLKATPSTLNDMPPQ